MNAADILLLVDITLLALLTIAAISLIFVHNLLITVVILGVFSFLMAAIYLVLGAPDVAITEAAIGAGVSTLLFLAAILLLDEKEKTPQTSLDFRSLSQASLVWD